MRRNQWSGLTFWTDERITRLALLWAEGKSAREIAAEFGSITRNAVIGKVHRLGLVGRATFPARSWEGPKMPKKRPEKPKTRYSGNPPAGWERQPKKCTKPQSLPQPEAFPNLTHAVSIFNHQLGQCRWIICDAVPNIHALRYCGAPVACGEASYCELHLWQSMYRNRRAA